MVYYAWPFAISAVAYLALGVWALSRRRQLTQILYALLCLATCIWQGIWAILFSDVPEPQAYVWLKICFTGIVLIPAIFYHFIVKVIEAHEKKLFLWAAYLVCASFA